jgi:antitoxin ParD1/3/4
MNVSLPAEYVEFVEGEVRAGEYASASEVVRAALRGLRREKALYEEKLAVLRREVGEGLAQARADRLSPRTIANVAGALRE